jgi:hypothetical protein
MKKIQFKSVKSKTWQSLYGSKTVEEVRESISRVVGNVRSGYHGYIYEIREIND